MARGASTTAANALVAIKHDQRAPVGRRPRSAPNLSDAANAPPLDEDRIVYRDPCPRCATRADIGCRHQRALNDWEIGAGTGHRGPVYAE